MFKEGVPEAANVKSDTNTGLPISLYAGYNKSSFAAAAVTAIDCVPPVPRVIFFIKSLSIL